MRKANVSSGFGPFSARGSVAALALLAAGCGSDQATRVGEALGGAIPVLPQTGGAPGTGGTFGFGGTPPGVTVPPTPFLDGKVERAAYAAPISGGTLLVTRDDLAIAADADRDRVFLVDLRTRVVRDVAVQPKDELGRIAEGPPGVAYVVARRGGAVLALDLAAGTVSRRVPVCVAPRGVAYDAATQSVHVACRSGLLVTLDAVTLESKRRLSLDPDLRDVLVHGSELVVTRFKSSELLVLDPAGTVVRRATPAPDDACSAATLLYRAAAAPSGLLYLAHQTATNGSVNTTQGGYGFSCRGGISSPFVGSANVDGTVAVDGGAPSGERFIMVTSGQLQSASGPLDIAVSRDERRVAVIATGNSWDVGPPMAADSSFTSPRATLFIAEPSPVRPVTGAELGASSTRLRLRGEPTAVAFDSQGKYVAQSREPATLQLEDGTLIALSDESHADTGLALFHVNSGLGLACASCHPDGDEDGHTWRFASGYRRTQPLAGGVTKRAPFHWTGDLPTLTDLVREVMLKRMALPTPPTAAQVEALGAWLDTIPAIPALDGLDAAAVARGRKVFTDGGEAACGSCHSGPEFSDAKSHDVGTGGAFVTPTLLGVGSRTPLLHDGCANNLTERFGRCGGGTSHGNPARFSPAEQADLIEFLRSL